GTTSPSSSGKHSRSASGCWLRVRGVSSSPIRIGHRRIDCGRAASAMEEAPGLCPQVWPSPPLMRDAPKECLALIEDMSRFVGKMALRDYQRFNEAPIAARRALRDACPNCEGGGCTSCLSD